MIRHAHVSSLSLVLFVAACSSAESPTNGGQTPGSPDQGASPTEPGPTDDAGPSVDNGAPSTSYPAPHPPLPQLVNQAGGKVLATPKLFVIVYPNYPHTQGLISFAQKLGASSYWSATTKEYGVGPIEYAGMKELTGETPPSDIDDKGIQKLIADKLTSGALGTADTNTLYLVVYPEKTTIHLDSQTSCSSFGGYHGDTPVTIGGKTNKYAFAVVPTCASFGGLAGLDDVTGAGSHEIIEAVTDPFPSTDGGKDSAYATVDMDHFIWNLAGGTESADLCAQNRDAFYKDSELGFMAQRSWSNVAAKASHDPCVPAANPVYFNSAPVLSEDVLFTLPPSYGGSTVPTKGVKIPVGTSKTIEVDLFSDGPTSGPWTVSAADALVLLGGNDTLDFAWDRTQGLNGEKLHLTITVKAKSTIVPGGHPFILKSTLNGRTLTWPGLVVDK